MPLLDSIAAKSIKKLAITHDAGSGLLQVALGWLPERFCSALAVRHGSLVGRPGLQLMGLRTSEAEWCAFKSYFFLVDTIVGMQRVLGRSSGILIAMAAHSCGQLISE